MLLQYSSGIADAAARIVRREDRRAEDETQVTRAFHDSESLSRPSPRGELSQSPAANEASPSSTRDSSDRHLADRDCTWYSERTVLHCRHSGPSLGSPILEALPLDQAFGDERYNNIKENSSSTCRTDPELVLWHTVLVT